MNLADVYAVWIEAERATYAYRYRWRISNNTEYLYKIQNKGNITLSMGPRSPETEEIYNKAHNYEMMLKSAANRSLLLGKMYKVSRLPTLATFAGNVLRSLDKHRLLGDTIQVVGTNALVAYQLEAQCNLDSELRMTEDLDFTWRDGTKKFNSLVPSVNLLDVIKESDATWTVSSETEFRLINRSSEVIELLIPPSMWDSRPKGSWKAVDTIGQEDLLGGMPVEQVAADVSGRPAKIVAPDPRLFMLHKWILSSEEKRKPQKKTKDYAQALQLKDLINERLPAYPLDEEFIDGLNDRLRNAWKEMNKVEKKHTLKP